MQVTFIVKNLTEETLIELAKMPSEYLFDRLYKWAYGDLKHCVSIKIGLSNQFRDRVEFNGMRQAGKLFKASKIEPRRGYKLVTFEI